MTIYLPQSGQESLGSYLSRRIVSSCWLEQWGQRTVIDSESRSDGIAFPYSSALVSNDWNVGTNCVWQRSEALQYLACSHWEREQDPH